MIRYCLLLLVVLGLSATESFATVRDTVYADSVYQGVSTGVISPSHIYGKPDSQYAKITQSGPLLDIVFYRHSGSTVTKTILPIKANSTIVVWCKKDLSVDTSAGAVTFNGFDTFGDLFSTDQYVLGDGMNVIQTPDTDYTYLEFTLPGTFSPLAKSFYIDAVELIEDTSQAPSGVPIAHLNATIGLRAAYPNPFVGNSNVSFTLAEGGNAEIALVNSVGVEVRRTSLGYLEAGEQAFSFEEHDRGMYFLRLYVDGMPLGAPIKVLSE